VQVLSPHFAPMSDQGKHPVAHQRLPRWRAWKWTSWASKLHFFQKPRAADSVSMELEQRQHRAAIRSLHRRHPHVDGLCEYQQFRMVNLNAGWEQLSCDLVRQSG